MTQQRKQDVAVLEQSRNRAMTIIAHLDEFRTRLIRCVLVIAVFSVVAYVFSQDIIEWVKRTFCPELKFIVFTRPLELFVIKLKVGLYMALFACIPYIAYETWQFIAPGLLKKERKQIVRYAAFSSFFFAVGGVFALFVIYPSVIRLSLEMSSEDIVPMITVESFISLAAMLILGFGIMFQLPIIVYACVSLGLVRAESMAKARPYVIVIIFVLSAILTPPDIISQTAMALPTCILFEVSLLCARFWSKKKTITGEQ